MANREYDHLVAYCQFLSFGAFTMGHGFVAAKQSDFVRERGHYDPYPLFIHKESGTKDDETLHRVEEDCRQLAELLGKFGIAKEYLNEKFFERIFVEGKE